MRTVETQAGPPRYEQTSPNPVTQQDLQQWADRLSDNLERNFRVLILNIQAGGEGTSNMPPFPLVPRLVIGQPRARNLDQPQVIALDPTNSPRAPQRSARISPSKGDARHVINERHLKNVSRDAHEVLNEKRAQSKARETHPILNRKQSEPREQREPKEQREPRERREPREQRILERRGSLDISGAIEKKNEHQVVLSPATSRKPRWAT